ncbi:MAG: ABC transporter permease [Caldilineaceae bacterium]|nr:ABC transporter permease [Caldilineaceae bacterium]MCY3994125.1 ABC transporter permease [Caldilineaceae bacterium]MDE0077194.1 ABC transporter permease [Caldilineaceae bacterium]
MSNFWSYVIRRAWQSLTILLGVSIVVFALMHLSGDPIRLLAPIDTTAEELEALRKLHGLDRPLPVQYWNFLSGVLRGDFGKSLRSGENALHLALERVPATARLALTALAFSLIVALPFGVLAAVKRNTWIDRTVMGAALIGQSMPVFWLGILLILVFAVNLGVLPATGTRAGWRSLILPGITLGMFNMARTARLLRSELLEVLQAEYIMTARAKGMSARVVLWRHAFRNAVIPLVTLIGLDLGALLAGSVITETIFAWPGIGRLSVNAIYGRDYPVVQAAVLVVASIYVIINFLVDLSYAFLNPRVNLS